MTFVKKTTTTINPKKAIPKVDKIHYDIFSKSRGYIATALNEGCAREALESLHYENQKFWRKAMSEGKRWKRCDVYCLCRQGGKSWELPFFIEEESDEDEQFMPEGAEG